MQSLDEYDFSPAPLYFGLINSSPWLATCLSAGSSCLLLLRHPPLANLYNSIVETINAYQDCPVAVSQLLELPSLVLRCSNGGLHDEAVDALMLADEVQPRRFQLAFSSLPSFEV
ncbi:hypothetical protein cyc_09157 [Cyclospora cayetanensis]|uniref:Uncharacterized protein n=1 Tax=Cyclospora cayetanensis TaxID=88456 RepID=A0A1D3D6T4_9EIME|nr:hypothetical protein cyc_09157 [Cyclospora cayetanensis]